MVYQINRDIDLIQELLNNARTSLKFATKQFKRKCLGKKGCKGSQIIEWIQHVFRNIEICVVCALSGSNEALHLEMVSHQYLLDQLDEACDLHGIQITGAAMAILSMGTYDSLEDIDRSYLVKELENCGDKDIKEALRLVRQSQMQLQQADSYWELLSEESCRNLQILDAQSANAITFTETPQIFVGGGVEWQIKMNESCQPLKSIPLKQSAANIAEPSFPLVIMEPMTPEATKCQVKTVSQNGTVNLKNQSLKNSSTNMATGVMASKNMISKVMTYEVMQSAAKIAEPIFPLVIMEYMASEVMANKVTRSQ